MVPKNLKIFTQETLFGRLMNIAFAFIGIELAKSLGYFDHTYKLRNIEIYIFTWCTGLLISFFFNDTIILQCFNTETNTSSARMFP
jgi:hypothetical protein